MTNRLLLVETSTTMRYVLEKHAQSLGFEVDATETYSGAVESLETQYQQFGTEYSGILFGWPITPQHNAARLAALLEQPAYRDLPVVVLSTDMRAETRAWAAGRDNTAVLPWKEYQGLDALLQRLIDVAGDDADALPVRFDNSDIHLLVVDDSATIRYSLRDLFQMQGYQVSLAATGQEALTLAAAYRIDIAVLDFYLTETTGDVLCRELMSSTAVGDIVCTVLTGTYSDHIIKRSLRAGAVECMFKNESSELLLSRIDAISRFVRQRRQLQHEQQLLEQVIEAVAGAVLVIEPDHRISYINKAGLDELKLDRRDSIVGQQSETLLEIDGPGAPGTELYSGRWRLPQGESVDIDYAHIRLKSSARSLIRFARSSMPVAPEQTEASSIASSGMSIDAIVEQHGLDPESGPFLQQMQTYLDISAALTERVSLLVLDVLARDGSGELRKLDEYPALASRIDTLLQGIYRRQAHVTRFSEHRYGLLLRHRQEPQVYLLVRKIMQLCIELQDDESAAVPSCTGSLVSITDNSVHSLPAVLQHAFKGVDLVNSRGPDQVLLMDLRRMLNAYPVNDGQGLDH